MEKRLVVVALENNPLAAEVQSRSLPPSNTALTNCMNLWGINATRARADLKLPVLNGQQAMVISLHRDHKCVWREEYGITEERAASFLLRNNYQL